jgi:hypothetical protein
MRTIRIFAAIAITCYGSSANAFIKGQQLDSVSKYLQRVQLACDQFGNCCDQFNNCAYYGPPPQQYIPPPQQYIPPPQQYIPSPQQYIPPPQQYIPPGPGPVASPGPCGRDYRSVSRMPGRQREAVLPNGQTVYCN